MSSRFRLIAVIALCGWCSIGGFASVNNPAGSGSRSIEPEPTADKVWVEVQARSAEELVELASEGLVEPNWCGYPRDLTADGFVDKTQISQLLSRGLKVARSADAEARAADRTSVISLNDAGSSSDLDGYLSVDAINQLVHSLPSRFPYICRLVHAPRASIQGRPIDGIRIGVDVETIEKPGVFLQGGLHGNELEPPEALLNFAVQLLQAYTDGASVVFGGKTFSATIVRRIVNQLDVIVMPLMNPDGRAFIQSTGVGGRKNRRHTCSVPESDGVDLNRNFDFLWAADVPSTSADPCNVFYRGAQAFSEPESRNMRDLLDRFPNILTFCDEHTAFGQFYFPWGDDDNQTSDPSKNFRNPFYNDVRGIFGNTPEGNAYKEFIRVSELSRFRTAGASIGDALMAAGNVPYPVGGLGEVTQVAYNAVALNYVYGRHIVTPSSPRIWAFSFEAALPPVNPKQHVFAVTGAMAGQMCQLILSSAFPQ
ncbi:MAG TPA: M14 family zinc carboxypeptidase [Blastocatellia bacterium]|nr:M14 family zinc carboxypeptidase [Blastocatellia bacterium]